MSVRVVPFTKNGGKGWEVDIRVRLVDGKTHRERVKAPTESKSAAIRWGREREAYILRHGPSKPEEVKKPKTFEEFVPDFVQGHMVAKRLSASHRYSAESVLKKHLKPAFGSLALDEITSKRVSDFVATDLEGLKEKTVNNILTLLKTMLSKAAEWKLIAEVPKISKLRYSADEMEFYDFDTFDRLVVAATKLDPRYLVLVLLGARAGLRAGEILALEWPAVRLDRGELHVRQAQWKHEIKKPKSGKARTVPLSADLAAALRAVPKNLHTLRVLVQDDGSPIDKDLLNTWMARIQRRAQLEEDGKIHILRHTFCSHLAMRGATVKSIQELAGHASITTTQRYMHLSPSAKSSAIALLDQAPRGDMGETTSTPGNHTALTSGQAFTQVRVAATQSSQRARSSAG